MIGVESTGVRMVTAESQPDTTSVEPSTLTNSKSPSPLVETGTFTEQTADDVSANPNIDGSWNRREDSPEVSAPQTGDIGDDDILQQE